MLVVSANWQAPLSTPPICNSGDPGCDAPVNIGAGPQVKSGAFGVNGVFQAFSDAVFNGRLTVSGGIILGNVRKISWPIQVCGVNGGACLGKYIKTDGSSVGDLRFMYNNASNQPTFTPFIYVSVPNSCPNEYSLVSRSTGNVSFYDSSGCGVGGEFTNTGTPPYGSGLACVSDVDEVRNAASRRNSTGCTNITQTINRATDVVAPTTATTPQYELR